MKKLLVATVAALALASPASAQDNIMTAPLGGGFESYSGTIGGQSFNGMSMPLGGGFRAYNGW